MPDKTTTPETDTSAAIRAAMGDENLSPSVESGLELPADLNPPRTADASLDSPKRIQADVLDDVIREELALAPERYTLPDTDPKPTAPTTSPEELAEIAAAKSQREAAAKVAENERVELAIRRFSDTWGDEDATVEDRLGALAKLRASSQEGYDTFLEELDSAAIAELQEYYGDDVDLDEVDLPGESWKNADAEREQALRQALVATVNADLAEKQETARMEAMASFYRSEGIDAVPDIVGAYRVDRDLLIRMGHDPDRFTPEEMSEALGMLSAASEVRGEIERSRALQRQVFDADQAEISRGLEVPQGGAWVSTQKPLEFTDPTPQEFQARVEQKLAEKTKATRPPATAEAIHDEFLKPESTDVASPDSWTDKAGQPLDPFDHLVKEERAKQERERQEAIAAIRMGG
jgi:hypothetical protein